MYVNLALQDSIAKYISCVLFKLQSACNLHSNSHTSEVTIRGLFQGLINREHDTSISQPQRCFPQGVILKAENSCRSVQVSESCCCVWTGPNGANIRNEDVTRIVTSEWKTHTPIDTLQNVMTGINRQLEDYNLELMKHLENTSLPSTLSS